MICINRLYSTRIVLLCYCTLIVTTIHPTSSHHPLPIVLVAGLDTNNIDMIPMQKLINKYLPDVYVKNVPVGLGKITSFWNLYSQVNDFIETICGDCNLRNGFNIIAFSQGGLVARSYIEQCNMPLVHTYISLGTPQRGVFGAPEKMDKRFKWLNILKPYATTLFYLPPFQRYLSIAGYWNDSMEHEHYLSRCRFLPYLNNEKEHDHTALYKENILKLEMMVLIQANCDEIVEPNESTHFGFYKQGTEDTLETLFQSAIYQQDTIGLRTLYEAGRLHLRSADADHYDLVTHEENFVTNILPFLTATAYETPA